MRIFIGSQDDYNRVNPNPDENDRFILEDGSTVRKSNRALIRNVIHGLNVPEYDVVILNNINRIGVEAFKATTHNPICNRLHSVTICGNLISIGKEAFKGCSHLQSINGKGIENVRRIEDRAFEDCQNLIDFPNHLPKLRLVGTGIFKECAFAHNIVGRIVPRGRHQQGNPPRSILLYCVIEQNNAVIIPPDINEIGDGVFEGHTELQSIQIPDNVTRIGENAFKGCSRLSKLSSNINTIQPGEFILPPNITTIEDGAFEECTQLLSIQIPDSVTRIGENAFKGCSSLQRLGSRINAIQPPGQFILPPNITAIEDGTFEECTQLQSIQIPDSVTRIGWFAFAGCTCLESILLNAVTEIGGGAFYNCTNLQSATIPNVKRIGWYAFAGCSNLTGVEIPVHATQDGGFIRSGAFCRDNLLPNSSSIFAEGDPRVDRWTAPLDNNNIEDDILNRMVNGIIDHYNDDGWLNQLYMWPMENGRIKIEHGIITTDFEAGTVNAFCGFSKELVNSLNIDNNQQRVYDAVYSILDWGKLPNIKTSNEPDDFTRELISINQPDNYNNYLNNRRANNDILINNRYIYFEYLIKREGGTKGNNYRIAFWSKVLSAFKPGVYYIYDSRVVYALSYISLSLDLPVFWNIPDPKSSQGSKKAIERLKRITEVNRKRYATIMGREENTEWINDGYSIPQCYCLYLELLNLLKEQNVIQNIFENFTIQDTPERRQRIVPDDFNVDDLHIPDGNDIRRAYKGMFNIREDGELIEDSDQPWATVEGRNNAIKAHLEKMLFMMKTDILKAFDPTIEFDDED